MADEQEKERYNQEGVMSAIKHLESTILDALKSKDPLWWRITQVILPIALTTILGLVVWHFQSNIQSKIQETLNEKTNLLQAQLGLERYLYERRLVAYQELYDKVLTASRSKQDLPVNYLQEKLSTRTVDSNLMILSEIVTSYKLISSKELNTFLFQTWYDVSKFESTMTTEELINKIVDQMRKDLFVDKLRFEEIIR
jgi:hypothetical protein